MPNTLRKSERLDKKKVIEKMFAGGSRSFSVFPLRVVYLPVEELEAPVSILVSVSKRRFKRAVKRNRVKRQIREAYRMNKHGLLAVLTEKKCRLAVAFIYLSDQLVDSSVIEDRMKTALARIAEKVAANAEAEVMELLHQLNKEDGRTIVMVTHNEEQAKQTSRTVRFFDGRQVE